MCRASISVFGVVNSKPNLAISLIFAVNSGLNTNPSAAKRDFHHHYGEMITNYKTYHISVRRSNMLKYQYEPKATSFTVIYMSMRIDQM